MNRGTMRKRVRVLCRGTPAESYAAMHLNMQLNLSAQEIALLLAENVNAPVNYGRSSTDIVPDGVLSAFPVYGVIDLHSVRDLVSSDHAGTRSIIETERAELQQKYHHGRDENGKYLYWLFPSANDNYRLTITATGGTLTVSYNGGTASAALAYNISAADLQAALAGLSGVGAGNVSVASTTAGTYAITFSGDLQSMGCPPLAINGANLTGGTATLEQYRYTVNFLHAPAGGKTFTLIYNLLVPEIPDTLAGDGLSFNVVPTKFHPAIVQHSVAVLTGHVAAPQTSFAVSLAGQMAQTAVSNIAKPISPFQMKT